TGLSGNTTYYYRIGAVNGSGTSASSSPTITVLTTPVAPVAIAATTVTATSFDANWNATAGATGYRLDVATDAGFSSLVVTNQAVAATTKAVAGLTAGTTYYY